MSERMAGNGAPLRVGMDLSIIRHPFAGSARWATGLLGALQAMPGLEVSSWTGHRRIRRGGLVRKVLNMLVDEYWLEFELPGKARRAGLDVLLMPVNVTSGRSPAPQVVTILDVNFLVLPETYDPGYASYARRRFQRSVAIAERITTISEHSRGQIASHLQVDPSRIEVVYPGLGPVRPPCGDSPPPAPYVLYVGATEPHKDVPTAIEAMGLIGDSEIQLAIVGKPGRDHERVLGMAHTNSRIRVIGAVSDSELETWYAHASAFVFPSRTEGFGYPPLEAMARGVPVVAARAGSLPEVLGDAALYHEPGSSEDLAAQLRRALADTELRRELVMKGRQRASRYTWQATAERMAAVLYRAAGRG